MRVAVISDVHANEDALVAVLEEIDAWAPDAVWCLGDTVGYGPAPNRCCELVSERADICLVGNHDLVALGTLDAFRPTVGAAALGFARRALAEARRHAKQRRAFGGTLADLDAVRAKLGRMALAVDASSRRAATSACS
jgi:alkylation response protein AidB-like acyl-CoA dehydrogenase